MENEKDVTLTGSLDAQQKESACEKEHFGVKEKLGSSDLQWDQLHMDHIVNDRWIDFRSSVYKMPDGRELGPFYTMSRPHYVVIVATDEDGRYICVQQFRQGIRDVTTEIPAGGINIDERPDVNKPAEPPVDTEVALKAAKRELQEETGYVSDAWEYLMAVPSSATIADNYAYIFKATNCHKVSGQNLDDTEFLHYSLLDEEELQQLIDAGKFQQAIHMLAYLLTKVY